MITVFKQQSISPHRFILSSLSLCVLSLCFLLSAHVEAANRKVNITIGTGGTAGVYYPAGMSLCKFINKNEGRHGIHCTAQTTAGSVENAQKVRTGAFDFAIVQSDVQYYALKGYGPFKKKGPDTKLRSVLSLYPEPFTIIARTDSGIRVLDDLMGKRVNIGNPGSGQRTSMELVMHAKGWKKEAFASAMELTSDEQSAALCTNEIDAMVMTVGHPNPDIKKTLTTCNAILINVDGPVVEHLVKTYPYYSAMSIPGRAYPGSSLSTRTFGVTATLVASAKTPDRVVKELLQALFNNFTDFKFSHPAFFSLVPTEMNEKGLTAPMHTAAKDYFQRAADLTKLLNVKPPPGR
ncbi:TAXI family TRAP transporter solute-binding subunit [Magnetovibrio sp.]|uniref:TAXI family TRAP transporter solute-binding subunit n=1 Tax=Magnetovibrio sp. TaxID=2024836 RepID=UPI002F928607